MAFIVLLFVFLKKRNGSVPSSGSAVSMLGLFGSACSNVVIIKSVHILIHRCHMLIVIRAGIGTELSSKETNRRLASVSAVPDLNA